MPPKMSLISTCKKLGTRPILAQSWGRGLPPRPPPPPTLASRSNKQLKSARAQSGVEVFVFHWGCTHLGALGMTKAALRLCPRRYKTCSPSPGYFFAIPGQI